MRYHIPALLLLVFCIMHGLISCSPPPSDMAATSQAKVGIEGQITEVHQASQQDREKGLLGAISVEGKMREGAQIAKASVAVTKDTRLLQQDGQSRRPITFESLAAGQRVQVIFRGPVAETFPMRATADEIVVLQ